MLLKTTLGKYHELYPGHTEFRVLYKMWRTHDESMGKGTRRVALQDMQSHETEIVLRGKDLPMELIDTMPVSFVKLDKDLKEAASTLSAAEARFIVDAYYTVQDYRIRFNNQIRALSQSGEPHELIKWHASKDRKSVV